MVTFQKSREIEGIIIILSSCNDEQGELSKIAISRLKKGNYEYKAHKKYKIILTGGYGKHFNTTSQPHAFYAKKFLLNLGVPEEDILEFAEKIYFRRCFINETNHRQIFY